MEIIETEIPGLLIIKPQVFEDHRGYFFESYNDVLAELMRIKTQLVISAEQINLLTGKDIY